MAQMVAGNRLEVFLRLLDDDSLREGLADPLTVNGIRSSILWALLYIAKTELLRIDAPVVASMLLLSWFESVVRLLIELG